MLIDSFLLSECQHRRSSCAVQVPLKSLFYHVDFDHPHIPWMRFNRERLEVEERQV